MMNIKRIIEHFKKNWLVWLIFTTAFSVRLLAALKIPWRPDEIVYVDWIGGWLQGHFWQYLFQIFHSHYPPRSDIFGNPPLSMWLMSLGIFIFQKIGWPALLGARLINVIIGSFSCAYLFWLAKKHFGLRVGLIAASILTFIPLAIVNSGTAYLDTLLALLVIGATDFLLRYLDNRQPKDLYALGLIFGLSILTKFVIAPAIFVTWVMLYYFIFKKNHQYRQYVLFIVITLLTPVLLWSGLRDQQHLQGIIRVYTTGAFSPYPLEYKTPVFAYYFIVFAGVISPIFFLGWLNGFWQVFSETLKNGLKKNRKEAIILIISLCYMLFNSVFARFSGAHQLIGILPLLLITASLGVENLFQSLNKKLRFLSYFAIALCLALPLISYRPALWSLYNSMLVGGGRNATKIFNATAGGEEVPAVANWIKENTPENSRIVSTADDWLFPKYVENRSFGPLFLTEGVMGARLRGADYAVISRPFLDSENGTIEQFSKLKPVYSYYEKNVLLANVYKIDYSSISNVGDIPIGSKDDWKLQYINSKISIQVDKGELMANYQFFPVDKINPKSEMMIVYKKSFQMSSEGISLEVFGDGNDKEVGMYLFGEDKSYLSLVTGCNWRGWRRIYIPFEVLSFQSNGITSTPNYQQRYYPGFIFASKDTISGEVGVRDMRLINEN